MDRIGRYKIIRELGRGAMGVVYHAIDPNIGRPVAIKTINLAAVLKPDEQERMRERLFREARSAGILSHPGIVTIYDVEQQGDLAYIAMEYVDGPTLDQLLSQPQPLPPERMFSILGQTSVALDYAHGKGIVHRDIKPANIMVARDGTAKITDFGIAKITASEQFTMTGSIVGTPHYMSPEQVQGQPVDGRSDQFSLAVIAFEMLTGEKPYTGEHLTTVVYKIVAEEPPIPHRINPTLSGNIEGVLRKGLAKKPDSRYRTCQEFGAALESACSASKGWQAMVRGGSLNAPTVGPRDALGPVILPPPRRPQRTEASANSTEHGAKRKSGFLPFLLAILMAGGLLAIVGWEAKPWLANRNAESKDAHVAATTPTQTPPASDPVATPAPVESTPVDAKPSPMPPPEKKSTAAEEKPPAEEIKQPAVFIPPPRKPPVVHDVNPQSVLVISSPGGAIAVLDGKPDTACSTPCSLDAAPGHHVIGITKTGYEVEHRDVDVVSSAVELPAVVLRAIQGTLMLSSEPTGAIILVDGKRLSQLTNAAIALAPGTHSITVEWKDGKQATRSVTIRNGINYEKFLQSQ